MLNSMHLLDEGTAGHAPDQFDSAFSELYHNSYPLGLRNRIVRDTRRRGGDPFIATAN